MVIRSALLRHLLRHRRWQRLVRAHMLGLSQRAAPRFVAARLWEDRPLWDEHVTQPAAPFASPPFEADEQPGMQPVAPPYAARPPSPARHMPAEGPQSVPDPAPRWLQSAEQMRDTLLRLRARNERPVAQPEVQHIADPTPSPAPPPLRERQPLGRRVVHVAGFHPVPEAGMPQAAVSSEPAELRSAVTEVQSAPNAPDETETPSQARLVSEESAETETTVDMSRAPLENPAPAPEDQRQERFASEPAENHAERHSSLDAQDVVMAPDNPVEVQSEDLLILPLVEQVAREVAPAQTEEAVAEFSYEAVPTDVGTGAFPGAIDTREDAHIAARVQPEQEAGEQEADRDVLEHSWLPQSGSTVGDSSARLEQQEPSPVAPEVTPDLPPTTPGIAPESDDVSTPSSRSAHTGDQETLLAGTQPRGEPADDRGGVAESRVPGTDILAAENSAGRPTPLREGTNRLLRDLVGSEAADAPVYRGPAAASFARAYRADAVTVGGAIVLADQRDEQTPRGLGVLVHELTHSAQAREPRFVPSVLYDTAFVPAEQEAVATLAEARAVTIAYDASLPSVARHSIAGEPPIYEPPLEAHAPSESMSQQPRERERWGRLPAPWEQWPAAGPVTQPTDQVRERGASEQQVSSRAETTASTAVQPMPVQAADQQRSLPERSGTAVAAPAPPAVAIEIDPDLDVLAREVYARLRRRLAAEHRRSYS
jgi:hypothetical protein